MKIFVSSTSRDLRKERAAVIAVMERMGEAVAMEKFFASDHRSRDECLARLRDCDGVVLVLGQEYGSIDDESGYSITELEYRTAKELNIPVFAFLQKNEVGRWASAETDPIRRAKHEAFKMLVDADETRKDFRTAADLEREVPLAIRDYEQRHGLLGARVSAFQTPEQFFRPFADRAAVFSHAYPLVGRTEHVDQLAAFARSKRRVALLIGRGGMGKTRILREALEQIQAAEGAPMVRLLREGVVFSRDAARELPAGPLLLVADDAHPIDGLPELLATAQEYPERIRLVLTSRPYGLPDLQRRLVEAGFGGDAVEVLPEVGDLTRDEVMALASEVLGPAFGHHADRLVAVSRDSPLVTVVGGRLLAEWRIDPALLANSDAFAREVFSRFQDMLVEAVPDHVGAERAKKVLRLVAALGPFRPDHEALVKRAAEFVGLHPDELHDVLSVLQGTGGLLQRGFSLRVTPDVLSDHILEQACVAPHGRSTRYADRVFERFHDVSLANLLRNLAELEWRLGHDRREVDLLGRIWNVLGELYVRRQGFERQRLVEAVALVAYFQPRQALTFARVVLEQIEPEDPAARDSIYGSPREGVLRALPSMLDDVAHYPDTIRESLDLLWDLRIEDYARPRSNPHHPVRVLRRLAKLEPGKPEWVYESMLDQIDGWLDRDDAFAHDWSPIDVLDALLKREGSVHWVSGVQYTWREFIVTLDAFGTVRKRAIGVLESLGRRNEPLVQRRVLESLLAAFWRPADLDHRAGVSDAELTARREENQMFARAAEGLLAAARSDLLNAIAGHALTQALSSSEPDPHDDAMWSLLKRLPQDFQSRLTSYLWNGSPQFPLWRGDLPPSREKVDHDARTVGRAFLRYYPTAEAVKAKLERRLDDMSRYGVSPEPCYFLGHLAFENPFAGGQLVGLLIGDPASPLARCLNRLLLPLREQDGDDFLRLVRAAAGSGHPLLAERAALALSQVDALRGPERELVGDLATHVDSEVRLRVIHALSRFPGDARDEALRVAATIDVGTDPVLADELCGLLVDGWGVVVQVPEVMVRALHEKLILVRELSNSFDCVRAFIEWLMVRDPGAVADLFLARVRRHVSTRTADFQPVPYARFWCISIQQSDNDARGHALRRARDAMLDLDRYDPYWLGQLFAVMSGGWDEVSLEVLGEWVDSRDERRIAAVGYLLAEAESSFVFDQENFAVRLLVAAERAGADTLRAVRGSLGHSARSGGGMGTPGQPMPHHLDLQSRATLAMARHGEGTVARSFYAELECHAAAWIERDQLQWEEDDRR